MSLDDARTKLKALDWLERAVKARGRGGHWAPSCAIRDLKPRSTSERAECRVEGLDAREDAEGAAER